jgi:NCAIR mutase (PurE)-related protein
LNRERLEELLARVARGELEPALAAQELAELPFADLGFAKLDLHRQVRSGLPEAVFGQGKRPADLVAIAQRLVEAHGHLLITRLDEAGATAVRQQFPAAAFHERARVLTLGRAGPALGKAAILSAGTSDLPVAEEAAVCAEWMGIEVDRCFDVGIAGVHRLFERLGAIRQAQVVIAVAGMDGALPTLVAGLIGAPVVAVPTSVGYGASFHGLAALLTMLNACAPGIAVVNIDNGYGAAVLAHRILAACQANMASP